MTDFDDTPYKEEQEEHGDSSIHIKWVADGSETLSDVARALREYADECMRLEHGGWQLVDAVDNSHGIIQNEKYPMGDPYRDWDDEEEDDEEELGVEDTYWAEGEQ